MSAEAIHLNTNKLLCNRKRKQSKGIDNISNKNRKINDEMYEIYNVVI